MKRDNAEDKVTTCGQGKLSLAPGIFFPQYSRGPFYEILKKAFPRCIKKTGQQKLCLRETASKLGITQQALGVSVRSNRCSVKLAKRIVAKGKRRVKLEELYEFVFK